MKLTRLVLLIIAGALIGVPAFADILVTFTPGNGCGGSTCFGNTFQLDIHPDHHKYDVTLTVNTSGNTNAGTGITAVDFKFGGGIKSGTLAKFDGGAITGWNNGLGTLNANTGCNYSSSGSFECALDSAFQNMNAASSKDNPLAPLNHSTYTWYWTGVTSAQSVYADQIHIGAEFGGVKTTVTTVKGLCTGKGKNRHCAPDTTTTTYSFKQTGNLSGSGVGQQVPEPASMLLLGFGMFGLAGLKKVRR